MFKRNRCWTHASVTHGFLTILAICFSAPAALAELRFIDVRTYPNGAQVPNGTVLTNQLASYGVLLGARRANEPVGVRGSVNFVSYGTQQCSGYWFFTPDVYGAVAIFEFVDPLSGAGIEASRFECVPGFQSGESLDIVGLDEANRVTASQTFASCGNCGPKLSLTGKFRKIEVRTRGNPGIGFPNCVSGSITTAYEACLSVGQQPRSLAICPTGFGKMTFATAGSGPVTHRWQYEAEVDVWIDLDDGLVPYSVGTLTASGVNTNQIGLTLNTSHGAPPIRFRCIVTNSCGSVTSDPATLVPCQSDLTCDNVVDDADFVVFAAAYNVLDCADPAMASGCPADLNGDRLVDDADFVQFVAAYSALGCEPEAGGAL